MPSSSATALKVFHSAAVAGIGALCGTATASHGWHGLAACGLGVVGTGVFLFGTWIVVQLAGESAKAGAPTRPQVVITVLALLLKLPLVYVGWVVSMGLGPFGPTWFLLGLALVYCLLIWRAVLAVRD
jgi:hypothetical protein